MEERRATASDVWAAVEKLIDGAPSAADLASHGLHLLAARRWRTLGVPVPEAFQDAERTATLRTMVLPTILERLREAAADPLVVFKGAAMGAHYPDAVLRPFYDLDVLAADAEGVQRRLLERGFVPLWHAAYYERKHHLAPLVLPQLPLIVEVHRRPEWVPWTPPPSLGTILERAVPARFGIDGVLVPRPEDHALLIAAHSWRTLPLRRILDLVDVSLLADAAGRTAVAELATEWGIERMWRSTLRAADGVLGAGPVPASLRTWARNVRVARDMTVFESHVRRLASPFWALRPDRALVASLVALRGELGRAPDEDWGSKAGRVAAAIRRPLAPKARHDVALADEKRERGARRRGSAG